MRPSIVHRIPAVVFSADSMKAWQIHKYSSDLRLDERPVPAVRNPTDVFVEVRAASVNPIDARMKDGYGREMIGLLRKINKRRLFSVSPFPLTLGRDFSGVVMEVGQNVKKFRVGDQVYGTVSPNRSGSHAEYVVTSEDAVAIKPKSLTFTDAGSVPYVACTVWAALRRVAMCSSQNMEGANALVHAGAGGIGSFAIQLLRAWGASVTVTCSEGSVDFVKSLGATNAIIYSNSDAFHALAECGPYDIVLAPLETDLATRSIELLGLWRNCVFVTLTTPALSNTDEEGIARGLFRTASHFVCHAAKPMSNGRWYAWAYFVPDGKALEEVAALIDSQKVRPVVQKVIDFEQDVPEALENAIKEHGKGKTVINVKGG